MASMYLVRRLAILSCVLGLFIPAVSEAQYTSFNSQNGNNILEGHWQSCFSNAEGKYEERVYDHVVNGTGKFELHMGPKREFAIFPGIQDDHREHDQPENLLKPYEISVNETKKRAKKQWEIPSLNLVLTVALAGGSRTDCESWFITLAPLETTSR
jgi:hypothetical protein